MKPNSPTNLISTLGSIGSILITVMMVLPMASFSQADKSAGAFHDPEQLVRHLYDQVTFPAGKTPDWDYVRTFFIKDAVVVMRAGKNKTNTLSLDGWVLDFVNFINDRDVEKTGFTEKVVKTRTMVFGDIAHVLVLYTAEIPGKSKAPQEGVDSFHLIRQDGKWQIVSILNEIPGADRPKPDILK